MNLLRLEFGKPRHGWMDVVLASGDTRVEIGASYMPRDSVGDLASAIALILKGGTSATVVWFEEPPEVEFEFTADGGRAALRVTRYPGDQRPARGGGRGGGHGGEDLLRVEGTRTQVCVPLWRGLRRLQSLLPPNEYKAAWRNPFPTDKVEEIAALLSGETENHPRR